MKPTPKIPPEILQLRRTYQDAQARLVNIIAEQQARGNVTAYRERILRHVTAELNALDKYARVWTQENISLYYNRGANTTWAAFRKANIPLGDVAINTRSVQLLAANAYGDLVDAHRFVGRLINDQIRQATIEAIGQKLSAGDTVRQAKQNLVQKLKDRGISAITDKRGRNIHLDAYAEMVARSTTREATNIATMEQLKELGHDLVQMSQHASSCPICAPLEGRVYSISGTSTIYPALDRAFTGEHANIHVNCRHVITPYIEKFDNNKDKTREQSQRPFDTDPRSERQRELYDKSQRKNTVMRNDRNQWERYRMVLPDDTPKTFSGFRRMKTSDSDNWQGLTGEYRSVMIKQI